MTVLYCELADALVVIEHLGMRVRDLGLLSSALERPRTDVFGLEAYLSVHDKAAALIDGINRSHPLDDGNKRLSWLLTTTFYELNDLDLYATADDGEDFILRVAGDHLELAEISAWLNAHTSEL